MAKLYVQEWLSPAGMLEIGEIDQRLCMCDWTASHHHQRDLQRIVRYFKAKVERASTPFLECAIAQLQEYFAGERREFDLPIIFAGTDFQQRVWQTLQRIPYGSTITYAQEAAMLGHPQAVRAVANANGANAISIIVPCHRVVGSHGNIGGYAAGIQAKHLLLDLEKDEKSLKF